MTNSSRTPQTQEWTTTYDGLDIHKIIPVSVTKLTLNLRVGFISSHLTGDKLFPVNPRAITGPPNMSLLLKAKSITALIIKPRLILVMHTDDLGWCITRSSVFPLNQQGKTFVLSLNMIVRKTNVTPRQSPYCTRDSIPIDEDVSGKLSYSHTSFELPDPSKWLPSERSDLSYLSVLQQQPVLSPEH